MRKILIAPVLLCLAFGSMPASADEVYTFVVKKQDEKAQTRKGWNLGDWITQRDKNRTSDLWLAMHTPNPYEFSLGGDYRFLTTPRDTEDRRLAFTAYARIFGIKLENENDPGRWNGLLNFRFFGLYQQATNLTAFIGIRSQSFEGESFRSVIYGLSGTLYLTHFAGLEMEFRHYGEGTSSPTGAGEKGEQVETNFFIDFRFLRIYGGYLRTPVDPSREKGYQVGAKIFF